MNHTYRLVWNDAAQRYVPAPETAKGRGKSSGRSAVVVALGAALLSNGAWAGPSGGTVSAGSGSIAQNGANTIITQSSQNLAINWASFNVAASESVNFVQPNASAIALNRVTGNQSSVIDGSLSANGQVWILNPNGVLFGSGASVNVGGLVASTLSLSDADFLAGKRSFTADGSQGSVLNQGSLTGGYVALLGKQVGNQGTITTANGTAALAAGDSVTLDFSGNQLLSVQVDAGTLNALAENQGLIRADNGSVILTASAKDALLDTVVNNDGVIEAKGIDASGGTIVLLGGFDGGTVKVGGTLDASASAAHDGGFIETSGAHVQVADGAKISTLSDSGKTGTWLVDPTDFTIGAGSGTQTSSGIGATTLANNLATTSVTLETDASSGSDSGDINVDAAVSWSTNTTLTLNAYNDININAAITATGDSAGLVLNHGDYATAGSTTSGTDYHVNAPITLSGANASLAINGTSYTLLHSMAEIDAIDSTGLGGQYALAEDLDASGTTYTSALVGNGSNPFTGTFTGLGHTVSNLVIDSTGNQIGLFGINSGSLRDVGLVDASIATTGGEVGALAGTNDQGDISNSYATGTVTGLGIIVGGLAGINFSGTISNSYAAGVVAGSNYYVGGLVGVNFSSTISNSYATGAVTGSGDFVGGLVGFNADSTISNSYATGAVTGSNDYVGGLAGINDRATISNSYATGAVMGSNYRVGGLVGLNTDTISNSAWDSATTGLSNAVGDDIGTVTNVTAVDANTRYNHASYSNLGTWTETASGSGVWVATDASNNKAWVMVEGATRPFLYSEYSSSVQNAHQLQLMALDPTVTYTLAADIDAGETSGSNTSGMWSTAGFSPVGNFALAFSGSLAGNGHSVSDLTINRSSSDFVGLIGYANSSSVISDVALVDASISGNAYVGTFAGHSSGSISNSHASGTVTGNMFVGGLVGQSVGSISASYATATVTGSDISIGGLVGINLSGSTISNSYATGAVTGSGEYVGGLAGINYQGDISNSYATGAVTGSNISVGGLVGLNEEGSVSSSYASGAVSGSGSGGLVGDNNGTVSASFWNTETSGQSSSDGGTGITTAQMMQIATFSDAGWDIASTGGSSSIWRIYEGYTAPLLRSFMTALTATVDDASKTYDGSTAVSSNYTLSDSSADSSLILGTATYSTSSKNVGSYGLGASGLYSSQQGYDLSLVDGTATVTAATLTVSGTTAANKTYDGTTSATVSGSLSGLVSGDSVTLSQSGSFNDKNAATGKTAGYTSSLSGSDAGNYVLASGSGTTTADITPAALTVTANDAGKAVGDTVYSGGNGVRYSGFVNGETSSVLGGNLVYGGTAQGARTAGSYSISADGLSADNYSLAYVDGSLSIRAGSTPAQQELQAQHAQQDQQTDSPDAELPSAEQVPVYEQTTMASIEACGIRLAPGHICN